MPKLSNMYMTKRCRQKCKSWVQMGEEVRLGRAVLVMSVAFASQSTSSCALMFLNYIWCSCIVYTKRKKKRVIIDCISRPFFKMCVLQLK